MSDDALRYPIGKFTSKEAYTKEELEESIRRIESLPARMEAIIRILSPKQLDTPYREGGWTARQVIHHVSDSHINAYVRFKWALTEDTPLIKAYNEKLWAETGEVKSSPELSLNLLKALHAKWAVLLKSLTAAELQREYIHPETKKNFRLGNVVAMYAWHGDHHLAHLKIVADKKSH